MLWNVYEYHIELTNYCIAACPFCARSRTKNINSHELSLEDIRTFFTQKILKDTTKVTLCGTYGDPIYAQDFFEIVKYFNDNGVRVVISTNGFNAKKNFWDRLWKLQNFYIIFWIDGITQKTHGAYRINTRLSSVLKNAKQYIDAGGEAHWQFLVFWSNEYQIPRAKELSKQLWFQKFLLRPSREFSPALSRPVWDYFSWERKEKLGKCEYKHRNMWYINAAWYVLPCCYLSDLEFSDTSLQHESMNIKTYSLWQIQKSAHWLDRIGKFTSKNENNICSKKCGYER